MRILQVRFKNLNSLVGEWQIDLTHPAFASEGIFAITGPTGAGKSTILDAICLALYGRTPRLSRITKSNNEIMSRQTGECFAEVTFETQAGRFRSHWSQHRAHKKADAELQAPKHEIADALSGAIFETKLKGVADQIESATGMDFDRFTRSMLLAQGGFAAFLQAAADERAPILEQITGTEIYSQISIRVHEQQREEREKLRLLQAETAGIQLLEPGQEQALEQQLATSQHAETELATSIASTGKAIAWLRGIQGIKEELNHLTEEANKLQIRLAAFAPDRDRLTLALNAASLDGTYASLTSIRTQQAGDRTALLTQEALLPGLESAALAGAEALNMAEQTTARTKKALKTASPLLQKVRLLDQKVLDLRKAVTDTDADCQRDATKVAADNEARLHAEESGTKARQALALTETYLREHAEDEWLIAHLAGVEEQLNTLLSRQEDILGQETSAQAARTALVRATEALDKARQDADQRRQTLTAASTQLQQGRETLAQLLGERLLREYRAEKETLLRELALLAKIAELESHRTALEDGKPCPVCGATQHPYAEGNVPRPDATEESISALSELIDKAEGQETRIKQLEEAETLARTGLIEAEQRVTAALHEQQTAGSRLADINDSLTKARAAFAERHQALSTRLQPLGIRHIPENNMAALIESLRARLQDWQARLRDKAAIEKTITGIDSELKQLDGIISTQGIALAEKQQRLQTLQRELAAVIVERNGLYGDTNPDDEERRFNQAIAAAEQDEQLARAQQTRLQQQWSTAQAQLESLNKSIELREPELQDLEKGFASALVIAGFADEAAFLTARLAPALKAELSSRARALDEEHTDLKARQRDREQRLAMEMAQAISDQPLEKLEPRFKAEEEALKQLRDNIASLKHRLSENRAAKGRIKTQQTAIQAQTRECQRWERLHQLIGSADGKKYRNFAQGLTFEMMIAHANRQLQKMSDRYLLVRDEAQPLELKVIDNYQAGETRSTRNLSGGESFIVSLALALGLSQMASKKVRVDSLFLDEGFGTLDDEALDTALETLASLQQDGKLIGIISHVAALKERISTQIQVTPLAGGKSRISGPGCSSRADPISKA
jgi:exonuclease SbcC